MREFTFDRLTGDLRVEDRFSLKRLEALETALITGADVSREGERIILTVEGIRVLMTLEKGSVLAEVQRHEWKTHSGEPSSINRLVIRPTTLTAESVLGYTLRPLRNNP